MCSFCFRVVNCFNNRFLRKRGMASDPKMEYQVFLCISFKPKVAITKLIWKMQKKSGIMKSGLDAMPLLLLDNLLIVVSIGSKHLFSVLFSRKLNYSTLFCTVFKLKYSLLKTTQLYRVALDFLLTTFSKLATCHYQTFY